MSASFSGLLRKPPQAGITLAGGNLTPNGNLLIGGISYRKLVLLQAAKSNYIRERRTATSPPDCSNQKGAPP